MSEARSHKEPWEDNAHARPPGEPRRAPRANERLASFRSAEAVSGVVKRLVPRSSRAEPRLCEAPTR